MGAQIAISEPVFRWCAECFKNDAEQIRVRNQIPVKNAGL